MSGYTRIDPALVENGVAVDVHSDGTLFVGVRGARAKAVEAERTKQQAPYRNIILAGRPLPPQASRDIGRKVIANAVVTGLAGTLPDGTTAGSVKDGVPELEKIDVERLMQLFDIFPDFEEDVATASHSTATFAAVIVAGEAPQEAPTTGEAIASASGN